MAPGYLLDIILCSIDVTRINILESTKSRVVFHPCAGPHAVYRHRFGFYLFIFQSKKRVTAQFFLRLYIYDFSSFF